MQSLLIVMRFLLNYSRSKVLDSVTSFSDVQVVLATNNNNNLVTYLARLT